MTFTCVICSHNKPDLLPEAVGSVLAQTYTKWNGILVDSGTLADAGYFDTFPDWFADGRISLVRSWETEETRATKAMAPWCFNECFRRGLVAGDLVVYLCDDDILYPRCFQAFAEFFTTRPEAAVAYASQDVGVIRPDGSRCIVGRRLAREPRGRLSGGPGLDCQIDGLQICHRAAAWLPWPEGKDTQTHADGVWMESLGSRHIIWPVPEILSCNRRTPVSTYVVSK